MCKRLNKALSAAGILIGFCAAFWPLGLWYGRRLTDGGDEPLGLVVLVLVAGLAIGNQRQMKDASMPKTSLVFLGLYLLSSFWLPPMLRCIPAILCIAFYFGWHTRPSWLALLLLSLPVVATLQFYLGYPMRVISAETTRWLIWPFVNDIVRDGSTLSAYGKVVGVDPPCSGVRMLWMGLVYTNLVAAMGQMSWLKTIAFNFLAVFLLLITNSVRSALLFAPESGIIQISEAMHTGAGVICYLGAILILLRIAAMEPRSTRVQLIS
ncbi:hypothetical protein NT6N_27270 [Oceaniferula spumae]|uniref:Exosortase/archaeosortase family protein n=1 Tax=Oceaniferula spumae TaxID=2979115 RepID=A0AAT9FNI7_9BACT